MRAEARPGDNIFVLKVTLEGSRPPIWRRLQVSEGSTLGDLHYALQIVMGWSDSHLHEFRIGHEKYGVILPDDYDQEPVNDENAFEVRDVLERKGKKFQYIYDFGDYWMHEVVVEDVTAPQPGMRYPVCIGGERKCPLEDCGGIDGYYDMLAIVEDPTHDEYESYREWLPDNFDPNAFDVVQTNKELDEIEEWHRIAESGDEFDDSGGAPVAHNYEEPVSRLLALGLPRDHFDYATLGIGGEHVPALILMATDRGLHRAETGSAAVWAPVHAWRALGQLRAETAIEPLVGLLGLTDEEQDEWAAEDLPEVFSEIGAAAIPALEAFLRDGSQGLWSRAAAGTSLGKIGQRHPEARDTCVTALTDQLERYAENDEELNAFLICNLMGLNAVESAAAMERAFAAGAVELSVQGDWEEVQIELGLLDKRLTPPPPFGWFAPNVIEMQGPRKTAPSSPPTGKKQQQTRKKRKDQKKARKKNRKK